MTVRLWDRSGVKLFLRLGWRAGAVHQQLLREGERSRLVSRAGWELLEAQPQGCRDAVLPPRGRARVSVEAASPLGWDRYAGPDGAIIAVRRFGASAPGPVVMEKFGFPPEPVVAAARAVLARPPAD